MAILSNGYTQNCQPQDWLLVANSEVGNLMLSQRIIPHICHFFTQAKFLGNPQDYQPQNWLLVDNPEVGNSEYVHYSGLPTPHTAREGTLGQN